MNSKSTILVMCVIVVQNVLAIQTSVGSTIPTGPILDLSILEAYRTVAVFQTKKTIQSISTVAQQGCNAKPYDRDGIATGDNLDLRETCEKQILDPFIAALDALLQAILVMDTEASAVVAEARITCVLKIKELVESICTAVELAIGENSAGAVTEIQVMADKRFSEYVIFNAAIFNAIQNHRHDHKIDFIIGSVQKNAIRHIKSGVSDIFKAITTLASFGTQGEKKNALSTFETTLDRAFSEFAVDLEIKFDVLKTIFAVSFTIQLGIVDNFPGVRPITESAYSNNEKIVTQDWSTCRKDEIDPNCCDQREITNTRGDGQSAREIAVFEAVKGTKLFFTTMETVSAKILPKRETCSETSSSDQLVPKDISEDIHIGRAASIMAWNLLIITILSTLPANHPAATLELKKAALSKSQNAINSIYDGITIASTCISDPSGTPVKIQAMKNTATRILVELATDIFTGLQNGQKYDAQVNDILNQNLKDTISIVKKGTRNIFSAIETLSAAICFGTAIDRKNYSFEIAEFVMNGVTSSEKYANQFIDTIDLLF